MKNHLHIARLPAAVLTGLLFVSCGSTPVTPTPVPVIDPPVITCPSSLILTSPLGTPIAVSYSSPSVVGGKAPLTTACAPASGSTFNIGTTPVTCTTTDAQARTSSCQLSITLAAPARLSLTKFAAFGDSITAGENGQNSLTSDVGGFLVFDRSVILVGLEYPTDLRSSLRARYSQQVDTIGVNNNGQPGEAASASATLTRFSSAIAGQQVVLLMEGSNDLYIAYSSGSSVTDAAIVNLRTMLQRAKAAGVRPYLATVPPMNPSACTPICRGFSAALVPAFNDKVRALASSEGVTLVDVNKAFNGDFSLLSQDGLHPNASGYDRIASTFFDAIKATLE